MEVLYFLLPLVLCLVSGAVFAFVWSLKDGQMDDLDTPAVRILFEEESERFVSSENVEGEKREKLHLK